MRHHLLSIMQKTGFGKRRGMTKQNASRLTRRRNTHFA
jgi:hypothetical protein